MGDLRSQPTTASAAEHSPLPWRGDKSGFILAPDGNREVQVAKIGNFFDKELLPFNRKRWQADLELIVEAVNSHAALVKALEEIAAVEPVEGKASKNRGAMIHMQSIARAALSHRSAKT